MILSQTQTLKQMSKETYHEDRKVDWRQLFLLTRLHWFPVGSNICIAPSLWGLLMSAHSINFKPVGSVIRLAVLWSFEKTMEHSAGCVMNDILDRHLDALVERSKDRPLASGAVSLRQAVYLAYGTVSTSSSDFSWAGSLYIGLISIVSFGWSYPLMKRWTNWPQAWLGLTFGWGILQGWSSLEGSNFDVFVIGTLWCGNICWTIVYDTIYACQDRKDDTRAGVKSTAVLFGERTRSILCLFAASFVVCLCVAGIANGQGLWYFALSVGGAACHLTWQLCTLDFNDKEDCEKKFKSNGTIGYVIAVGLLCDYLL